MNALEFLLAFNHKKYTLAYLGKGGMRSFPALPENLPKALTFLERRNKSGDDIYFMVNEGNGEFNKKKTACHGSKNVVALSAIFLDAETANGSDPSAAVEKFCADYFCMPTFRVTTSPHRYHYYWLINDGILTKENIRSWQQIQTLLHSKLSSDRTMTDIPQILRIPLFKNVRKNCEVDVTYYVHKTEDYATYSLHDLYKLLQNNFPEISDQVPFHPLPLVTPEYTVPEGERHEELLRRVRKLYGTGVLNDEEIKCFADGFIQNHIKQNVDFLPGGKRREEVERILSSAKSYALNEKVEDTAKKIEVHEKRSYTSPFELDPDFFYNAPGNIGKLTRHIVDTSDYPIPSHAFAAAVSIYGFAKARYVQGRNKLPPLNYFLCLAPSGSGKTHIERTVKNILLKLQLQDFVEDGIASAQGLFKFLHEHHGLGLVLYDEVKQLFQTIQHRHAASYEVRIGAELTRLYTAYASYYTPSTTKTDKGKRSTISKPLLSFIGYGHFTLIEHLFTKESVLEGLIPRFIILNVNHRTKAQSVSERPVPTSILDDLRHHITLSAIKAESDAQNAHIDIGDPDPKIIQPCPDAQSIFDTFEKKTSELYESAVRSKNGLEALFSRGVEQSLRLALAMVDGDCIDPDVMTFTTTLINSQQQQFYEQFDAVINSSKFAKETDRLFDKIVDMLKGKPFIKKRELQQATHRWYNGGNDFRNALQSLIEQGKIVERMETIRHQQSLVIELGDILN